MGALTFLRSISKRNTAVLLYILRQVEDSLPFEVFSAKRLKTFETMFKVVFLFYVLAISEKGRSEYSFSETFDEMSIKVRLQLDLKSLEREDGIKRWQVAITRCN